MKKIFHSFCAGVLLLAGGCSCQRVEEYKSGQPTMDIREFFNGPVEAKGMFMSRSGKMELSFHADMQGTWNGNDGVFEEHFLYSDGRKQERKWKIHFTDANHFTATAHDVIGQAEGGQAGNAMNMKYVLAVTTGEGKTYNMNMDDWMFRMDEHTVLNHITMRKFGFKTGELFISFSKQK